MKHHVVPSAFMLIAEKQPQQGVEETMPVGSIQLSYGDFCKSPVGLEPTT